MEEKFKRGDDRQNVKSILVPGTSESKGRKAGEPECVQEKSEKNLFWHSTFSINVNSLRRISKWENDVSEVQKSHRYILSSSQDNVLHHQEKVAESKVYQHSKDTKFKSSGSTMQSACSAHLAMSGLLAWLSTVWEVVIAQASITVHFTMSVTQQGQPLLLLLAIKVTSPLPFKVKFYIY